MTDLSKLKFGATAWGAKLFAPDDVESFSEVAKQVKQLPFHSEAGRGGEVVETFAPMDEEGYDQAMVAAAKIRTIAKDLGMIVRRRRVLSGDRVAFAGGAGRADTWRQRCRASDHGRGRYPDRRCGEYSARVFPRGRAV